MNTDKIIHEWFYRLPKGYAIAPYTKQELDILDEVLAENGLSLNEDVDILDQAFNDAKPVKDEEKQHTLEVIEESLLLQEGYTKDDLIAVIKETPLPDKLISYISRLIDSANSKTSALDGLKKRNFDDKTAKGMFDKAVEMDSYKQLQDLVAGEVSGIDFDSLGDSGNLQPFIDKMGFSKEYADWLYNYIPAGGGVNVGAGENILRVILKGGHVPSSGDVGAEGIKIELKSTQSSTSAFRMRGQSGYGSGYDIALDIFEAIQTAYGDNLPDNFPDVTSSTAIQLYYKSGKESLADQYLKDLVKKNLLKRSQIVDIYSKALQRFYKKYQGNIKGDVAEPGINSDGSFNIKELFPRLSALEFRYYADSEPWDEFMSLNYKKDYLIMGKDDSIDELTKIFKDRFNIGAPNTKPKATSQDSMTATQLKST
tara:strand:+ start:3100 stop:4377 length:1278 start_codon:yes stop_codon:yes gene_type:complete